MNLRAIFQKITSFLSKNEKQIISAGTGAMIGTVMAEVARQSIDNSTKACRDSTPFICFFASVGAGFGLIAYNGYKAAQRKLHPHSTHNNDLNLRAKPQ